MGKYLEYTKTIAKLNFQSNLEYKTNLYVAIFVQIFQLTPIFLFVYFLGDNFGDVINWSSKDFILYTSICFTYVSLLTIIYNKMKLFFMIKKGNFNNLITRPLSIYFQYFTYISTIGILFFIMNILVSFFIFNSTNYSLIHFFYSIILIFPIIIYNILLIECIESFNFVKLGLSHTLNTIMAPGSTLQLYPAPFFYKLKYFKILYFYPMFLIGSLIMPIVKGEMPNEFILQLTTILILTIIYLIVIMINWHYGLKKYEAYG